ncbi:transcriptional regulator [Bosea sp. Leaf344]|uniref:response regulator n=1 Tax=Bosea sp. Leaf344 TaxID=1736346 RepID=UPI0006FCBE35|nr:response regulator [Bosea sp. Leaf344]KQU49927.1 transcriptional regulator [Bosea sp. Leaf344]
MTTVSVLLVEDELLIRMDIESSLVEAGFDVVDAANGADAMRIFDERPADFSAVITDIRLGQGSNGWEVARYIRASVPTMPVVYISGDSTGDWSSQGVPNSVMIAKPFAFSQIITAISMLLNQPDQLLS